MIALLGCLPVCFCERVGVWGFWFCTGQFAVGVLDWKGGGGGALSLTT